jgi:hypothetical protein
MILTSALYNLPVLTKVLLSSLAVVSALIFLIKMNAYRAMQRDGEAPRFHDILVPYLQLVPRTTLYYPWVVVPAIFAEITVLLFVVLAAVLGAALRYVERFWGYREVVKFVLVVGALTNLWTVLVTIVYNVAASEAPRAMDVPLGGGILYYVGFLVVLKQLIPEHNVILFKWLVHFRVKQLALLFLAGATVWLAASRALYPAVPLWGAFVVAYAYLRFYQALATDPLLPLTAVSDGASAPGRALVRGDASDAFRLVEFFPQACKPYLLPVFDTVYEFACLLGVVTPFNDELVEQSNARAAKRLEQASQALKSVANLVAERRRQVALQMIEERIGRELT